MSGSTWHIKPNDQFWARRGPEAEHQQPSLTDTSISGTIERKVSSASVPEAFRQHCSVILAWPLRSTTPHHTAPRSLPFHLTNGKRQTKDSSGTDDPDDPQKDLL
ncbi:hypothetical protein ACU8KH_01995 [Lachancea thermotolerans]